MEKRFTEGLDLDNSGSHTQGQDTFESLAAIRQANPRLTAAILMSAKCSFSLHQYQETGEFAVRLIDEFPQSRYKGYAYYLRAAVEYENRNYAASREDFTYAIEFSDSEELLRTAESAATNLVAGYIRKSTLDNVYNTSSRIQTLPMLSSWLAN